MLLPSDTSFIRVKIVDVSMRDGRMEEIKRAREKDPEEVQEWMSMIEEYGPEDEEYDYANEKLQEYREENWWV